MKRTEGMRLQSAKADKYILLLMAYLANLHIMLLQNTSDEWLWKQTGKMVHIGVWLNTMNIQFTIVSEAEILPKSPGKVIHILG